MAKGRKTGGRRAGTPNRATREIKELAGALVPDAYAQLRKLLRAKGTGEVARLRAIEIVLERAFGRPMQAIKHSGAIGSYDLSKLNNEKLRALEAILSAASVADGDPGGDSEAGG